MASYQTPLISLYGNVTVRPLYQAFKPKTALRGNKETFKNGCEHVEIRHTWAVQNNSMLSDFRYEDFFTLES